MQSKKLMANFFYLLLLLFASQSSWASMDDYIVYGYHWSLHNQDSQTWTAVCKTNYYNNESLYSTSFNVAPSNTSKSYFTATDHGNGDRQIVDQICTTTSSDKLRSFTHTMSIRWASDGTPIMTAEPSGNDANYYNECAYTRPAQGNPYGKEVPPEDRGYGWGTIMGTSDYKNFHFTWGDINMLPTQGKRFAAHLLRMLNESYDNNLLDKEATYSAETNIVTLLAKVSCSQISCSFIDSYDYDTYGVTEQTCTNINGVA